MKLKIVRKTFGYCPCCQRNTIFIANDYWLRDHYHCIWCKSIPRQRAVMKILKVISPDYKVLKIHEGSPSGASFKILKQECMDYTYSYFYENIKLGEKVDNGGQMKI